MRSCFALMLCHRPFFPLLLFILIIVEFRG
jgi:hypothetical protein